MPFASVEFLRLRSLTTTFSDFVAVDRIEYDASTHRASSTKISHSLAASGAGTVSAETGTSQQQQQRSPATC